LPFGFKLFLLAYPLPLALANFIPVYLNHTNPTNHSSDLYPLPLALANGLISIPSGRFQPIPNNHKNHINQLNHSSDNFSHLSFAFDHPLV